MRSSSNTVSFYAPQGWGKSTIGEELCQLFGCETLVDEFSPDTSITKGALHLTNDLPIDYEEKWKEADFLVEIHAFSGRKP